MAMVIWEQAQYQSTIRPPSLLLVPSSARAEICRNLGEDSFADFLQESGANALPYRAGLEKVVRSRHQDMFLGRDGVVMVATIAFGLGIDKPDVRFVLHADLPANIESYYHEIGRAGRDGLPADTLTLFDAADIRLRRMQIAQSGGVDAQKAIDRKRLDAPVDLCESERCRRQNLLGYFGESAPPCGNCDICLKPPRWWRALWRFGRARKTRVLQPGP